MAKCSKLGSSSRMSDSVGPRAPITTEFVRGGHGSIIIGDLLILQVLGQQVRARCGFALILSFCANGASAEVRVRSTPKWYCWKGLIWGSNFCAWVFPVPDWLRLALAKGFK